MMQDMATGSKEKDAQLYKVLVIGDYAVGTSRIPPQQFCRSSCLN